MSKRVLTIGILPELSDLSAHPGLTPEKIRAGLQAQFQAFRDLGFEPYSCQIDLGETAEEVARAALAARTYDLVLIGAGLRMPPPLFHLFERIINLVHAHAPTAKIAFNTTPGDTLEAALRWVQP